MSKIEQRDIDDYVQAMKRMFPPQITSMKEQLLSEISVRLICIDGTLRRIADALEKEDT